MQCLGLRQDPVTELEIVISTPYATATTSTGLCARNGRPNRRVATTASVPVSGLVSDAAMLDVRPDVR